MPPPLSARKRNAILDSIRTARQDGASAGQIARDHSVARSTVTKLAADNDLGDAFERAQTAKAAHAKQLDNKAKRAQLASDLLDDAQRLRGRIWGSHKVVVSTPLGAEVVTLDENPLAEIRSGMTALGIAIDKSVRLEQVDADGSDGMSAVDEWLRGMMGETR